MNESILYPILFVTVTLFVTLMGNRIVNKILDYYHRKIAKRFPAKFSDLLPLIKRIFNICLWVWCVITIATYFKFNIIGIYAGLGLGSLVTAMIVKESITNIIAGITIMFDRPFREGDEVKLHTGDKGHIHSIGLRRTQICIPRKEGRIGFESILIIPNKDISRFKIYNYTLAEELENE